MMKFLCDVHISYKLVSHLKSMGFETIHVNDILDDIDPGIQYYDSIGRQVIQGSQS